MTCFRCRALLVLLILGLLAAPLTADAQQASKVPRVGVLWGGPAAFANPYVEASRRALGELGYVTIPQSILVRADEVIR